MRTEAEQAIRAMVNRETQAWDTQDADALVDLFHPDMVWPWPATAQAHDPMEWVMGMGRYDRARWRASWQALFDTHRLVHNIREIRRIEVTDEADGGFAVVDIDTLWQHTDGTLQHWQGRVCKVYTKVNETWKLISHIGVLTYP
ncbi:MAG: nuclear transport factor 2 family protein [Anaerolineae bacterium]|nr:nuclear transport factor 2 family protein [Anaerolineae bacterium]